MGVKVKEFLNIYDVVCLKALKALKVVDQILHFYYFMLMFLEINSTLKCMKGAFPVPSSNSEKKNLEALTAPALAPAPASELFLPGRGHIPVRCSYTDTGPTPLFVFWPFLVLLCNSLSPFTVYCCCCSSSSATWSCSGYAPWIPKRDG